MNRTMFEAALRQINKESLHAIFTVVVPPNSQDCNDEIDCILEHVNLNADWIKVWYPLRLTEYTHKGISIKESDKYDLPEIDVLYGGLPETWYRPIN